MNEENKKIEKINKEKKVSNKKNRKLEILNSKFKYDETKDYSLEINDVYKTYGQKKVLNGVSFKINKGEKVALIGKNGSGKSTLISIISQQTRMSKGLIKYGYAKNKIASLEGMGIQFQTLQYPEGFIVKDVIHFFNVSVDKVKRMSKSELSDVVSLFGIEPYLNQKIDRLSGGQQQRINILLALIKKPKLLILDEISTGLDVESAEKIKKYIDLYLEKNKDVGLLLVSHSDEEIREIADKVFVLENGEIVEEFPSSKLTNDKFLEITSREIQLTVEETLEVDKKNEKIINSFVKSYGEREGFKPGDELKKENEDNDSSSLKQTFKNNKTINKLFYTKISNSKLDKNNIIEITDLSKTYSGKVGAIRNLSLTIEDGERISITGPNGSGKTTLVEIISFVKNYDLKSSKFSNMIKLSKYDYEKGIEKNKQEVSTELRRLKNAYRIERENAKREIEEVKKDEKLKITNLKEEKKTLSKELKENISSIKKEDKDSDKIVKLKEENDSKVKQINEDIKKLKESLNENIKTQSLKIQEEADKKVSEMKANYLKVEEKLNEELKEKNDALKISYESNKEEIILFKEEVKKSSIESKKEYKEKLSKLKEDYKENISKIDPLEVDIKRKELKETLSKDIEDLKLELLKGKNDLIQTGGYINNGKEIEIKREINYSPTLMYSFAETKRQVKDETGVQFQYASFPVEMSVKDVILFFSRTNKYYLSTEEMVDAIKVFKLENLLKRKAYKLSGGERQRLNVLLSIMKSPRILILDEISTGLDVDSIVKIDKFIKSYLDKTKATLILISHNYHEVHSLTNKIVVMKKGKLNEIVNTQTWNLPKVKEKMKSIYKGGAI